MRNRRLLKYYNQQSGKCVYCDSDMDLEDSGDAFATIDHVIPRVRGGSSDAFNEVACCFKCNQDKGAVPVGAFLGVHRQLLIEDA